MVTIWGHWCGTQLFKVSIMIWEKRRGWRVLLQAQQFTHTHTHTINNYFSKHLLRSRSALLRKIKTFHYIYWKYFTKYTNQEPANIALWRVVPSDWFPCPFKIILVLCYSIIFSSKEPACQCRRCKRHSFSLWVGKIPWRRAWQPSILSWGVPWTEEPGEL